MSEQQILEAIKRLPSERWPEILRYLASLQTPVKDESTSPIRTAADLLNSGLIGIWSDRPDISDRKEFARRLRQQSESRQGQRDAN